MRPPPHSDGCAAEMLQEGSKFLQVPFVTTSETAKVCRLIANGSHWGVTSPQNQQPCGLCHDPGQFEAQVVTSRSCLITVVLKISPTASPWSKRETAACMHPYCLPAACHILQSQCWPRTATELRSAGTWLAFPRREPEAAARIWGASGREGTPVTVPGLADAEEEHKVPGTPSWAPFKQPFVTPWVVCAGEPALRGHF